jgi:hypothetical protein
MEPLVGIYVLGDTSAWSDELFVETFLAKLRKITTHHPSPFLIDQREAWYQDYLSLAP